MVHSREGPKFHWCCAMSQAFIFTASKSVFDYRNPGSEGLMRLWNEEKAHFRNQIELMRPKQNWLIVLIWFIHTHMKFLLHFWICRQPQRILSSSNLVIIHIHFLIRVRLSLIIIRQRLYSASLKPFRDTYLLLCMIYYKSYDYPISVVFF